MWINLETWQNRLPSSSYVQPQIKDIIMGIFDMFKSCNEITQKVKCSNKNKLVNQLDIYIKGISN